MSQLIQTDRGPQLTSKVFARCIERGDEIVIDGRIVQITGHVHGPTTTLLSHNRRAGWMGGTLLPLDRPVDRVTGGRCGGGMGAL